jgi:hypothetical protein
MHPRPWNGGLFGGNVPLVRHLTRVDLTPSPRVSALPAHISWGTGGQAWSLFGRWDSLHDDEEPDDGLGEWWAAFAVIALAAMAIVSLTGSADPAAGGIGNDPTLRILASLDPTERSLDAIESAFASLCQEPVLLAFELEPDCESRVIFLSDDLFDGYRSNQLGPVAKEDVAAAMPIPTP